jgi:outer membrane protein assembly factor BamB
MTLDLSGGRLIVAGGLTDSVTLGGKTFVGVGGTDVLVASLDATTGSVLWADQPLATNDNDSATAACVAANGYIYVAGRYVGNDPPRFGEPGAGNHIFVAKYGLDGKREWIQLVGNGEAQSIYCDYPRGILVGVTPLNTGTRGGLIRLVP